MSRLLLYMMLFLSAATRSWAQDSANSPVRYNRDNIYVGISYQVRTVNDGKLNDWFLREGMGPVNRARLGEFLFGGFMGDDGLFEARLSILSQPSEVFGLQMALGFFSEVWSKGRSAVYVGAMLSYEINEVQSISAYVPPALRDDTIRVPAINRDQLDLRQRGFGIAPEVKYILHTGKTPDYRFSFFAAAGFQWHLLSKWRFSYRNDFDGESGNTGLTLISRPAIPSNNRLSLFARAGILFKFKSKA